MAMSIHQAFGQISPIEERIREIVENKALKLGFALYDFSDGKWVSIHGDDRFPMQSVFKFPIALAILHQVDKGALKLDQDIPIGKTDIHPDLWSPISRKYPQGNVRIPLSEIIRYTVSQSDNIGCDLLLKLLNGASTVDAYMHDLGITDIRIRNNEREIQSSWNVQFDNWATPTAMVRLLKRFLDHELLFADTHAFLWNTMVETSTGSLKNKLPTNAVVAHKTGTSGSNREKISAATNDVGIMMLPDGKQIAFAIFITDSKEPAKVNAAVITDIALLLYRSGE